MEGTLSKSLQNLLSDTNQIAECMLVPGDTAVASCCREQDVLKCPCQHDLQTGMRWFAGKWGSTAHHSP